MTKKIKVFKALKISIVSEFSFSTIKPIWKDGNDGNFRKPDFVGKFISRMLF